MRIGILSMQKVINYGSFMQAYALRSIIKNVIGENPNFIDIESGKKIIQNTKIAKIKSILKSITKGLFFEKIKDRKYLNSLKQQFEQSFFEILDLKNEYNDNNYDYCVIGSDEVFHCCQNTPWGFTRQLYGDVRNASNVISYAGSFGATTIELIKNYGLEKEIVDSLKKLRAISVRDNNSYEIIKELLPQANIYQHLDPVLLYDFSSKMQESSEIHPLEDYLVVYSYTGRINNKKEINSIKQLARKNNLKIYTIFCRYNWADKTIVPDTPFQLLRWFFKAKYIISDTFHGTIFSIITHKKFCTLVRPSNMEKLSSLLNIFELGDRMIFDPENISKTIDNDIDYAKVDEIRKNELEKSKSYLREYIK